MAKDSHNYDTVILKSEDKGRNIAAWHLGGNGAFILK